ncbi:AAA family ATPase [Tritonibacter mobilis]|uniref:Adenylyl-sulfate kinase n=1 Tax=Tritonibacter mobilis F1926 TaxID=1265309 RepID=A0A1B1A9H8_9RHOB|nr:AAA family ATPase [Tritonibacter mobilis]ANP43201.1 adenylyl-sulfate kinase [Tritonibacter mobilis F1926]KJZ24326.1 adenylylsulfate kinase [Tritonibacter mobilis]
MTILVSLSGLPGVGKTTLAKALAAKVKAVHLRVDSVEAALKNSVLKINRAEDAGYLAIASVARDNLLLGFDVIADTVNPIEITRNLWAETAASGNARILNVEVVCSDRALHRSRVKARASDIPGFVVPDWQTVSDRTFEPWREDRLIVDTSISEIEECVSQVAREMDSFESTDR